MKTRTDARMTALLMLLTALRLAYAVMLPAWLWADLFPARRRREQAAAHTY